MARKRTRKTAFVPRIIFSTVFASVVPACVIACGGSDSGTAVQGDTGFSVADVGFDTRKSDTLVASVAADSFGVGVAFDTGFSVADVGFDTAGDGKGDGTGDSPSDTNDASDASDATKKDFGFGVAAEAFSVADDGFSG
jgi:hypothetical protein